MGNKASSRRLSVFHDGAVAGDIVRGVVVAGNEALDQTIMTSLLKLLHSPHVVKESDLVDFEKSFPNPLSSSYIPWFFNRHNEYGEGHLYYESLNHAFPHQKIVQTCSARLFASTTHFPLPPPFVALVESVRDKNSAFLDDLRGRLLSLIREGVSQDAQYPSLTDPKCIPKEADVDAFIEGAFRNVAIQIHVGQSSHPRELTRHRDHIFSALHMAITLRGKRTVGFLETDSFATDSIKELTLLNRPGTVYVTSPAAITHGVSFEHLGNSMQSSSVSMQCRTFLDRDVALVWKANKIPLCNAVCDTLRAHPVEMPSTDEFQRSLLRLSSALSPDPMQRDLITYRYHIE